MYLHICRHVNIYINIERTFIYFKALQKDLLTVSMWYYVKIFLPLSLSLSHIHTCAYVQTLWLICVCVCVCVRVCARIALPLQSKAESKPAQNMRVLGSELLFLAHFFFLDICSLLKNGPQFMCIIIIIINYYYYCYI